MKDDNKTLSRLEREMQVKTLLDNLDLLMQQQTGYAKAVYHYYSELQKAGFSQMEAMELVKIHGMVPPFK